MRRPVLFAFGGVVILLMAAALWTRPLTMNAPTRDADPSSTRDASVTQTPPTGSPTPPGPAASEQPGRNEATDAVAPAMPPVARDGKSPPIEPVVQPAVPSRPATPSRRAAEARRAEVAPPAPSTAATAPAVECTPQVDALGLCEPGAKFTGR